MTEEHAMRTSIVVVGVLCAASLARPVPAQDRTALLEVPGQSFVLPRDSGQDYNYIRWDDTEIGPASGATHRQSLRVNHEFPGVDTIAYRLYEPDKVTRTATGFKATQKDQLWVKILLPAPPSPYNTFTVYGVVTGCKIGRAHV